MNKKIAVMIVLIAGVLASRWLFTSGFFTMHDDLQIMRQLQMEKCWQDGQIPCRWVPDLGFGYGYPLFNFYPPLPFYVGHVFRLISFSFVNIAKILFILQFIFSGITMYVLVKDLWDKWAGVISSVFYIWAPYHSVDVYVRGALNEAWAFIWFPLILWAAKKMAEVYYRKDKAPRSWVKYALWLGFSFAMLLLSHNLMVMIFIPILLFWIIFWWFKYSGGKIKSLSGWAKKSLEVFGQYLLSALLALGLAAFFTLPMYFEQQYTHIETMFSGYFDWRAHFVSLHQLFTSRFWGYGPSVWQEPDGMAFPIGHFHWILALIVFIGVWFKNLKLWLKSRKVVITDYLLLITGLFVFGLIYSFLMHNQSTFIWIKLPILQLTQFPWRLLAILVLLTSIMAGYVYKLWPKNWLAWILIIGVVIWNWTYFQPQEMWPLTDKERFKGDIWKIQQTAGIYDYLPIAAQRAPQEASDYSWDLIDGSAENVQTKQGSYWYYWQGEVIEAGQLRIDIFNFPGWRAWVNEEPVEVFYDPDDILGRNQVELEEGYQEVYFQLTDTPIRKWSNLISLLSWSGFLIIVSQRKWKWLPIG